VEVTSAKRKDKEIAVEMRAEKRRGESTPALAPVTEMGPTTPTAAFNPYQQLFYCYPHMYPPPIFQYPMSPFLIPEANVGPSNAPAFYNYSP